MTPELTYLAWSVALLLVHLVVMASFKTASIGLGYGLGPRDGDETPHDRTAQRLVRAFDNYRETWPAFIALALLIAVTNTGASTTALGAAIWFWCRVAYVPIYAFGIPYIRTVVWAVSLIGLLMMLFPVLF